MRPITEIPLTYTVELTKEEVQLIRDLTANAINKEYPFMYYDIRKSLYDGTSEILQLDTDFEDIFPPED